jgi:RNA:NAD 2'-phosphotransferase (TPT1/KptA family)
MSQKLSLALTQILRHQAERYQLEIRPDGYILIDDLLKVPTLIKFHPDLSLLQEVVKNCPKQRFDLRELDHKWYIRANQGHSIQSIEDEKLLQPLTVEELKDQDITVCIHGTYMSAWEEIQKCGYLSKMSRQHIHFSAYPYGDKKTISGMRGNVQVLLYLDLESALRDGLKFYLSQNRVILSLGMRRVES